MDLLRYSDTKLAVCFKDKTRREINDVLRQIYIHPEKIQICACIHQLENMHWIRKTLQFLNAEISNEPSHQ
jgi:hypothetical protein